jgi:putative MATE family efflux protein
MAITRNREFLGTDKISSLLIRLSLPALIGMLSNALYNLVDAIFVGHGAGSIAIAGLSIAFPLQMVFGAFALMYGVGAASISSIMLGKGDGEKASKAAGNGFSLAIITSLIISVLCFIFLDKILFALGASDNILPYARDYSKIIIFGIPFLSFSMVSNNLIRATGDAKASMKIMLLGTLINIILDPIFIFGFDMGIKGAAYATIIGQIISSIYALSYFLRGKYALTLTKESFKISSSMAKNTVVLGTATFVRQIGTSLIALLANNLLGIYSGDLAIAAYGLIIRLTVIFLLPTFGLNQGIQPIIGYNFGARKIHRIKETLKLGLYFSLALGIIGELLTELIPSILLKMFTVDPALLAIAVPALRIYCAAMIFIGIQSLGATYYQAIGRGRPAIVLGLLRQIILLIPLLLILPPIFGITGIWLAFPISDALSAIITAIFLVMGIKKLNNYKFEID